MCSFPMVWGSVPVRGSEPGALRQSRRLVEPKHWVAVRRSLSKSTDVLADVLRPSLVGALVMKAAAHTIADAARGRHRLDFVTLAALVGRADFSDDDLTKKDCLRLKDMVSACRADPIAMEPSHADLSLERLSRAAGLA